MRRLAQTIFRTGWRPWLSLVIVSLVLTLIYIATGAHKLSPSTTPDSISGPATAAHFTAATNVALTPQVSASSSAVVETITLRGLNNEVLRDYQVDNGDEVGRWKWTKDYVYASGRLLASESPGGIRHYHLDHLGTMRVITNGAGDSISTTPYEYFAFGDEATAEPPGDERFRFTGHERDINDPLKPDYMHARYYYRGGSAGKFLTPDPGRDWDPMQPQSWNLYSYVRNNPVNSTDPTGKQTMNLGQNRSSMSPVDSVLAATPAHRNSTSQITISLILKEAEIFGLTPAQTAYVLATAYHESHMGNSPVERWNPAQVHWQRQYDRKNGNTRPGEGYLFRGRGDAMTTGTNGYVNMGQKLGLGLDLYFQPQKMTDPVVSARGIVLAMRDGTYTGKRLGDYINAGKTDFFNARSIVNGDKSWNGRTIANYARAYERALLSSGWPQ